ncbi:hypothetical protein JAB8_29930 [Janthinobacterium sp. HH106]|nr:hypothetical protein JAB8_29930 [Janthinobacterium sp. HH106]
MHRRGAGNDGRLIPAVRSHYGHVRRQGAGGIFRDGLTGGRVAHRDGECGHGEFVRRRSDAVRARQSLHAGTALRRIGQGASVHDARGIVAVGDRRRVRRAGEGRRVERGFQRQRIGNRGGEMRIASQRFGQFGQGIQGFRRAIDQGGNRRRDLGFALDLAQVLRVRVGLRLMRHHSLGGLVVGILARGQHDGRINFQLDGGGAGDDQHHAHHLRAPAALDHQGLVAGRAVGHGAQVAGLVVDADFAQPPAAHVFGQDLLDDDLAGVGRVDGQLVQVGAAHFMHERLLQAVWDRQGAVAVADAHFFQFQGLAQGDGIGQFGLAHLRQNGKVCAHG